MRPLSHTLAVTALMSQRAIAPVVEQVERALHHASRDISSAAPRSPQGLSSSERAWREPPTRLTQAIKLASAAKQRTPAPPWGCLTCGVVLGSDKRQRRRYCDDCSRARKSEVARATRARMNAPPFSEHWGLAPEDALDPEGVGSRLTPSARIACPPTGQRLRRIHGDDGNTLLCAVARMD